MAAAVGVEGGVGLGERGEVAAGPGLEEVFAVGLVVTGISRASCVRSGGVGGRGAPARDAAEGRGGMSRPDSKDGTPGATDPEPGQAGAPVAQAGRLLGEQRLGLAVRVPSLEEIEKELGPAAKGSRAVQQSGMP